MNRTFIYQIAILFAILPNIEIITAISAESNLLLLPVDCPELELNFGDTCDDGNPDTDNDVVTEDCECEGNLIVMGCTNSNMYPPFALEARSNTAVQLLSTCNNLSDYVEVQNIQTGHEYILSMSGGGFISVRSETYDGTLLGAGYSPLTVVAESNQNFFAHWSLNADCELKVECSETSIQCTSCEPDCPDLDKNYGDLCDDGNPETGLDVVSTECNCQGNVILDGCINDDRFPNFPVDLVGDQLVQELASCSWESEYTELHNIVGGKEYLFSASIGSYISVRIGAYDGMLIASGYSPLSVFVGNEDALFIHWSVNDQCDQSNNCTTTTVQCINCDVDCPEFGTNIGADCDDGDVGTLDDIILSDCVCQGIPDTPCESLELFPNTPFELLYSMASQLIGDCISSYWHTQYAQITNVQAGEEYLISITDYEYIKVRTGGIDGPIIGQGYHYFSVVAPSDEDLFVQWNSDENCGLLDEGCRYSYVKCLTCNEHLHEINCDEPLHETYCYGDFDTSYWIFTEDDGSVLNLEFLSGNIESNYDYLTVYDGSLDTDPVLFSTLNDESGDDFIDLSTINVTSTSNALMFAISTDETIECGMNPWNDVQPFEFIVSCGVPPDCEALDLNIGAPCDDGSEFTENDVVTEDCECVGTPALVFINGAVDWNSNCSPETMEMKFYQPGTDILLSSQVVEINTDGEYEFVVVQGGYYDVFINADGFLQKGAYAVDLSGFVNELNFDGMVAGDINGDNYVNIIDVSILNSSYGFVEGDDDYNPISDLNCDGGVNISDVSLINIGFGLTGDAP